ncbi:YqeG family HAD IIIA-type phosphatase [Cellulosilyticum sp. I15G10I2]|uniref:YqeG family HAD IIIA-type phosphatase n=1 Tax=Cellulosilyticum sp. I15G10I2 TaxID=1892843 RepID=UPI00085C70DB|nr:YqeG family HAD IIIA-type phosphatase [Cellulosilyticum sp. I15G10I2]
MIKKFFPTHYLKSIYEIDIKALQEEGIKGIIFDIDNTLVPYDEAEPNDKIITFFGKLREAGFKITLVSNNTEDRVIKFNEKLKVFAIHKSKKPLTKSFKKALRLMDCQKEEAIIVGDQIFTDIYGGNKAGIKTILVVPVSDKDEWITKIKRGLEKKVISYYEKKQRNNNG